MCEMYENSLKYATLNTSDESIELLVTKDDKLVISLRYVMIFLTTFAAFLMFYTRAVLSLAIVVMVNNTHLDATHNFTFNNSSIDVCDANANQAINDNVSPNGEFVWSEETQGLILGAYFYGYTASQILGGRLAEQYGGKQPLAIAIIVSTVCNFLTPISAHIGVFCIVLVRAVMGFFHGLVFSAIYTIFSQWIPKSERATALAMVFTGANVGTALAMPMTAYFCESRAFNGWPLSFYAPALVSLLWIMAWTVIASDSAQENGFISERENLYIQNNLDLTPKKIACVPWMAMLSSGPVWAVTACKCGQAFGYSVLAYKLPKYLESVLKLDIGLNGAINASVFVGLTLSSLAGGPLSDYFRRKNLASITNIRKAFLTLALLGPIVSFVLIPFAGCDVPLVSVLLVFSMLTMGLNTGGDVPILADMAPAFSGTVFGVSNTFASSTGFIAPQVVGAILGEHESRYKWNIIFLMSAAITFVAMIVFNVFATAEPQTWAVLQSTDQNIDGKHLDTNFKNAINIKINYGSVLSLQK